MKFHISAETAEILVADPSTSSRLLAEIAAQHRQLWARIRLHGNVYDELLAWIDESEVAAVAEDEFGEVRLAEVPEVAEASAPRISAAGEAAAGLLAGSSDATEPGDPASGGLKQTTAGSSDPLLSGLRDFLSVRGADRSDALAGDRGAHPGAGNDRGYAADAREAGGEHEFEESLHRERELRERFEAESRARIEAESRERIALEGRERLQDEALEESRARAAAEARLQIEVEARARAEDASRAEAEVRAQLEARLLAEEAEKNETLQLMQREVRARGEIEAARLHAEDEIMQAHDAAQKMRQELQRASYLLLEAEARMVAEADARAESDGRAREEARLRVEVEAHLEVERQARLETEQRIEVAEREEARARAAADFSEQMLERNSQTAQEYLQRIAELEGQAEEARKGRHVLEARLRDESQGRLASEARAQAEAQARTEAEAREGRERLARVDAEERLKAYEEAAPGSQNRAAHGPSMDQAGA